MSVENRTFRVVPVVRLTKSPSTYTPPFTDDCPCDPYLVTGKTGGETWEKDTTSAWKKLYLSTDTVTCTLQKEGVAVAYAPVEHSFVNDLYSKYFVTDWTTVLNDHGAGCYSIHLDYTIGGVSDTIEWGEYRLFEYDNIVVDKTVRLKAVFNSRQTIEDIDFTGSNVVDTFRFEGYFGDRQPQTEIDNVIYTDRKLHKVTRENLNKYTLFTNLLAYNKIQRLVDLYLLSENEMYISDFNALNPSRNYLDFPCIVSESAEIKYFERERKSTLTVNFSDKVKNERSFY
jgi:hypothetical protein